MFVATKYLSITSSISFLYEVEVKIILESLNTSVSNLYVWFGLVFSYCTIYLCQAVKARKKQSILRNKFYIKIMGLVQYILICDSPLVLLTTQ